MYVATWFTAKVLNHLLCEGINVKTLMELVNLDIRESIINWKMDPPNKPKIKGKRIQLPDNL